MRHPTDDNLEHDLRNCPEIVAKIKASEVYAQHLYAALCNNDFFKTTDVFDLLRGDKLWGCSWRYAGSIIANIRGKGDYLDWYCSGIMPVDIDPSGFVAEATVTEEIEQDLNQIGWYVYRG